MLGIPVSIAEAGLAVIELGSTVVAGVDGAVVADAKTGVLSGDASFEGALRIVTSNLSGASDTSFVEQIEERVTDLVDDRDRIAAETSDSVLSDPPGR
jgi:formiminotetrahydrofolate cyclodeaminase